MHIRTRLVATASALALAAAAAASSAPVAMASGSTGTTPLSDVLLADGDMFDDSKWDYDIVTQAALTVITATGGDTDLALLTQGDVALTAFLPRDVAFYRLVKDLTGSWPSSEEEAFAVVAGLGVETVEKVLLYHVVPGGPIDSAAVLGADGARLATADGGNTVKVNVITRPKGSFGIKLVDKDPDMRNPWVVKTQLDINAGNKQLAHGISRVLIPVDL